MATTLLERARDGDPEAMNLLLERHKHLAYSLARRFVRERADAEDIVQEAFIKVFLHIRQFRSESLFGTWLYRIVYREAIRYLREQQPYEELAAIGEVAEEMRSDYSEDIENAMEVLNAKETVMINLFYLGEKTIKEIASITQESASNVKVILHRARQKMNNQKK